MSSTAQIHVISKADIAGHKVLPLTATSLPSLQDGHVRLQAAIISLTNNNLSYAQLGGLRNWWETYPVPEGLQAPYNDSNKYGIVPAWGYGGVLESKLPGIEPGMLLWGFWPTMNLPIDLELVPADATGHWIEVSEGRKNVMKMYQRYVVRDRTARLEDLSSRKLDEMAWESAVRPIWECGYLLNKAIFSNAQIHPNGIEPWSKDQADLNSAVVVSLSASSKTARSFHDSLINHRAASEQPVGLLAITSSEKSSFIPDSSLKTKVASYQTMTDEDTLGWVALQNPGKVVIVDFGGRGDSLHRMVEAIRKHVSNIETLVVGVGGDPTLRTVQDLGRWAQRDTGSTRIQMNNSGVRDALMATDGAEKYFADLDQTWNDFPKSYSVNDLELEMGEGIAGINGFEGGWTRICDGKLPSNTAVAYRT